MSHSAERINEPAAAYVAEPRPHRWSSAEYRRVSESGIFSGRRVELVEGAVIDMPPMGRPHWVACQLAADALRSAFGGGYFVTSNLPAYLDEYSEPEPDVAVLEGDPRAYADARPITPVLVIEVADTSLDYDRTTKTRLYADHGILDYWIVNLHRRQVEVRRRPVADPDRPGSHHYDHSLVLSDRQTIPPLAAPNASIAVTDLLP